MQGRTTSANHFRLSTHKMHFLNQDSHTSYQLKADELPALTEHYFNKHKIKIMINGQTQLGQQLIQTRREGYEKTICFLNQDTTKYVTYIKRMWYPPMYYEMGPCRYLLITNTYESSFRNVYFEMRQKIRDFLTEDSALKENLSEKEQFKLNELIKKNPEIAKLIDNFIPTYLQKLDELKNDISLDQKEAADEMEYIQKNLEKNESVGYLYTSGHKNKEAHFEGFIITPTEIIKTVNWFQGIGTQELPKLYYTHLPGCLPQGGDLECGTLSLLYLKELLKNKGEQLNELTLRFPYYQKTKWRQIEELNHFFLPSPQVLRYSQSSTFNKKLVEMVENTNNFFTPNIKVMLYKTIQIAKTKNESELALSTQALLDKLPTFTKKWLEEYAKIQPRREAMYREKNCYLAYSTWRMKKLAHPTEEEKIPLMTPRLK